MVCQIIWTPKALETYISNIEYLESRWAQKEINRFIADTEKKVKLLSRQPQIGSPRNTKHKHVRHTLIHI